MSILKGDVARGNTASAQAARLEDVARLAQVSSMTVSRFLRHPEKVAFGTRRLIEEAIRKTRYVPNLAARSLASSRSNVVVAVVPSMDNSLFAQTLNGLMQVLRENGLQLVVANSTYAPDGETAALEGVLGLRPCGIVLHNTHHSPATLSLLERASVPIVETGDLIQTGLDAVVSYSNFDSAFAMTAHLIEREYRTIAFASIAMRNNDRVRERRRGFRAALRAHGREVERDLIFEADAGFRGGATAVSNILQQRPDVDAIFFAGGVLSIGALFECQRRGWAVPERVAIAGFDDYEITTECNPPITTLRIPRFQIGQSAGRVLVGRLRGRAEAPARIDLGFELAPRATT